MIVARLSFYLLLGFFPAPSWSEQVRTVIPRATLNYLSVPVAEVKGYFRDQNLENQTIIIPGSTAIAALVSGQEAGYLGLAMYAVQAPMTLLGGAVSQVYLSRAAHEHREQRE